MRHEIGTKAKNSNVATFALAQLRKYLAKLESDSHAPQAIELLLCPASDAPEHIYDGFQLDCSGNKLVLRAVQDRGLLNGVYEILSSIGFSFPFPGIDRLPAKPNWPALKNTAGKGRWFLPSFRHRILHFDNMRLTESMIDWIGKLGINMIQQPLHVYRVDIAAKPDLAEMVSQRGMELNVGCHGFDNWLPPSKYGQQHPDWYSQSHAVHKGLFNDPDDALVPASDGHICLSNPEVIEEFAGNVIEFLSSNPQVRTVSLWPNDGIGGWCTCPRCLALEPEPDKPDPQTDTPGRSASYLWFVQQVGKLVRDKVPEARIEFAAFYDFATPPQDAEVIPSTDHYLGFVIDDYFGCVLHGHGQKCNRERIENSHRKWRKVFPHEIYACGYYADLHKIMDFPIVFTTKISQDFDYLKEQIGIDSVMTLVVCADLDYLLDFCFQNIYSFAKLSWDHRRRSEDILRELAQAISPASSDDVLQYLSILDRLGRDNSHKHAGWIWLIRGKFTLGDWWPLARLLTVRELISPDKLASLRDCINDASAKAKADDAATQILNGMLRAFRMLELMAAYDSDTPLQPQLALLDEIAKIAAGRGNYPSSIVPALEAIRRAPESS